MEKRETQRSERRTGRNGNWVKIGGGKTGRKWKIRRDKNLEGKILKMGKI